MDTKEKIAHKILLLINQYKENGLIVNVEDFTVNSELYGRNGILNSFDLVTLIVDLEEYVQEELKKSITIADEKVLASNIPHSEP